MNDMDDDDSFDEEAKNFYAEHEAGGPDNVVVATLMFDDGSERTGIFHSVEKAQQWVTEFDDEPTCIGSVFAPYVVDVPEFGNVTRENQQ